MQIQVIRGDITQLSVDAIVNAANSSLMGGGGVDGAIHRAGGPAILKECKQIIARIGRLPAGEAVITTGGNLPSRYVIHTVGPVWKGGRNQEAAILSAAYRNCLKLAVKHHIKQIAFPNISTGIYGFPKDQAARIALKTVKEFCISGEFPEEALFVCFDEENYSLYLSLTDNC
ncbi:MAG: O-acetyl-ADP-ribose deacetylase [Bacteroidales bacterium]|nr:O-acetyl-ADP-ribose deacetylase [Bacteroidales bacterium]